jgi:hypothetical protein
MGRLISVERPAATQTIPMAKKPHASQSPDFHHTVLAAEAAAS